MRLMLAILAYAFLAQQITVKIPENAKEQEIQESVKALSGRIAQYGYRDLSVSAGQDKRSLLITSPIPVSDVMQVRLNQLMALKASEMEVRFIYPISQAELEQFKPGEAAPKGVNWIKWKGGWAPVRQEPTISVKGHVTWYPKKISGMYDKDVVGEQHLSFDATVSKRLSEIPAQQIAYTRLFVDGQMIEIGGSLYQNPKNTRWTIGIQGDWDILGPTINNPIPLALSR
jgi:hypothetical protein